VNTSTSITKNKLLVLLGPTATGKSSLGVSLAQEFISEIISADSRQIYQGLDIGTGKIAVSEMQGIPHYLLSIIHPNDSFSVVDFKTRSETIIADIHTRNILPILVGGTGFYIHAIVDNWLPPEVPTNNKLREELYKKSPDELYAELLLKDPERAQTIEKDNPRRLIRALEIIDALGSVPKMETASPKDYSASTFDVLQIGLQLEDTELRDSIKKRVEVRLNKGFVEEVKTLQQSGISWERLNEIGLGYRIIAEYLQGTHAKESLLESITASEWQYVKRQMRWFKRDARIQWFSAKNYSEIENKVKDFLVN
jgi:tRNA dimethylallyltransferase